MAAKRGLLSWLLWPLAIIFGLVMLVIITTVVMLGSFGGSSGDGSVSEEAERLIPSDMLALYQSSFVKQQCPGLSWTVVAAITHLESRDNRNPGTSVAGAKGANQFMPKTWDRQGRPAPVVGPFGKIPDGQGYGMDGNGDGIADIMNPYDSVPAAARMLCANGGGNPETLPNAIFQYNRALWYVYGGTSDSGSHFIGILPLAARLAGSGVVVTPSANFPGRPLTPELIGFLERMAVIYGDKLVVTTGTRHNLLVRNSDRISDHVYGNAADFGMSANGGSRDSPVGDAMAAACLLAAGDTSPVEALETARKGGAWSRDFNGYRVQCIWKTYTGGDHHNHVHVGIRRL